MAVVTGIVKKTFEDYGFISVEGQPKDVFFHVNEVKGKLMLAVGDMVHFHMGTNKGKSCAKSIKIAGLTGSEQDWFTAASEGDIEKLECLAKAGQDINGICREKQKCQRCDGTGEGGIKVSKRNWVCEECEGRGVLRSMSTAVVLAIQNNKLESLKALVGLGANVRAQTPLFEATRCGKDQFVQVLLNARADPNKDAPSDSPPPMFIAASAGHVSIVSMLLEAGADPDASGMWDNYDDYGDEVECIISQEIARRHGHQQIVTILKDWKEPKPLSLHILSRNLELVELSIVNIGGNELVRWEESLKEGPHQIWDKITKTGIAQAQIRLILPDGSHCTHAKVLTFQGTLKQFLGLEESQAELLISTKESEEDA